MVAVSPAPRFWKSAPSVIWTWLPTTAVVTSAPVMPSPAGPLAVTVPMEMLLSAV